MKRLYRVFNKNSVPTLIVAENIDSAKAIMHMNGRVRKIENISKVLDITNEYVKDNPNLIIDLLNDGLFYKKINSHRSIDDEFGTYGKY